MPLNHSLNCLRDLEPLQNRDFEIGFASNEPLLDQGSDHLFSKERIPLGLPVAPAYEKGAILGTGHLSPSEIVALVREANKAGVEKILIQHPLFPVPNLPMTAIEELVALGATVEIDYCGISPMWAEVRLEDFVQLIERFGAERCILVSDAGQTHNPMPSEALRLLAQNLYERGISEEDLHTMMVDIPEQLLEP